MNDTVKLLRECDAGIQMGVESIEEVLEEVDNDDFRNLLLESREKHWKLGEALKVELEKYGDEGKSPNPMAKGMSYLKTNFKIAFDGSDATIADLITDGCNMGTKSLGKFLNEFKNASDTAKNIARELIDIEDRLLIEIRKYL